MFDLIGAAFSIVFLFAIAGVVSIVLGLLTWLSLLRRGARRKRYILGAILLPLATAAWLTLCVIVLPGESLFGDIDQPLPHSYRIKALGKMPEYGHIDGGPPSANSAHLPNGWIGRIAIQNDLVAGQCSQPFNTEDKTDTPPYFIFDTAIGKTTPYATEAALDSALGHHIELTELAYFRSPLDASHRRIVNTIELVPPALVLFLLIVGVTAEHRRALRDQRILAARNHP